MIRVLLVDDQHLVRAGFRMILEAEDDLAVVGEAANGRDAVDLVPSCRPDVVLMDIRMPELDGIEATAGIRAGASRRGAPQPAILVLTTFDLDEYVFSALRAGASGFLLKDTPPEQLVDAVRVVARGDALLAPSVTRRLIDDFARRSPVAAPPGLASLTERELDVLRLVARGLNNAEIAAELYLGEATVKTHLGRVLTKLDLRDRVQAGVLAYQCGLVTPGA